MFIELHAHSCYSLLDGVATPEALIARAAALEMPALALTDHDAVYGLPAFETAAEQHGLHAILGAELTLADDTHLTLLAETQAGYANLCRLITLGRRDQPKGESRLPRATLAVHADGLIALTGCRRGGVAARLLARDRDGAARALAELVEVFGRGQVVVELQRHLQRGDVPLTRELAELGRAHGLPVVATGNVHYLERDDGVVQSALTSIRTRVPLTTSTGFFWRRSAQTATNHERFLRGTAAMLALYADLPEAVHATEAIAARCLARLPRGLQVLPPFPTPPGHDADSYLHKVCWARLGRGNVRTAGARERACAGAQAPSTETREAGSSSEQQVRISMEGAGGGPAPSTAEALLEKELGLIRQLGLANYFLVVADIVAFCKREGILCHGRGSAANSLVAHLLGISAVDPIAQDLVVERFLSVEHGGTPDIDLDIDAARRERVIQYVYDHWGREHAAMACTYVTYRSRSAVRDAAYALGMGKPGERGAWSVERKTGEDMEHEAWSVARVSPNEPRTLPGGSQTLHDSDEPPPAVAALAERLLGLPRHLGLHNGGMIVSGAELMALMPIEPASMEGRTVVQFDKEGLEVLGIVKIDLLGLRMLSAIADALAQIRETRGKTIDLYALDGKDPAVFDQICSAHTIGLFQVESGAQVSIIPHLQPRCFQDLIAEVSLIRPGPLQGNMVRPYIRRRQGLEPVQYLHASLKPALAETYGVIVFQEQVIKIARDVAGFTPGRGELLRRALGAKDPGAALAVFRGEFLRGAEANGVNLPVAEQIWMMLKGFAGYSFSKAHAAAFAVIVYWSAWLRVHYAVEYFCGLLRNAPLGTYPAHVLEAEARRCGIRFLPFDIQRSPALPAVVRVRGGLAIRHGLGYVKGIGDEVAEAIVAERANGPFESLANFVERLRLDRRAVENLVLAGAFDELGERRGLLWDLAAAFELVKRPPTRALPFDLPDERPTLRPMSLTQKTTLTFAATGVTGDMHLVELRRDAFTRAGCLTLPELRRMRPGARVRVGGLVADGLRRPPTAKGTAFIRLEQPDGLIDVIVPAEVYAAQRPTLRSPFLAIDGVLQRVEPVPSVVARDVREV